MSDPIKASSAGVSADELLGVAFVILKLCGVIDWSWWAVTAPFWVPLVGLLLLTAILMIVFGVSEILK